MHDTLESSISSPLRDHLGAYTRARANASHASSRDLHKLMLMTQRIEILQIAQKACHFAHSRRHRD